ncbi:zinc finger MYND domain-containing protein, putative [Eimeria brunetti]|uniref:Zinc finger MYND domain-containing protein, putative n=1 Tax=Eimeria brunetti TaxID=51314 RepID=U6LY28_9EIME|nr:zinc finger MYND domain-containing protein, putative [Eimeria brunetti]
MAPSGTTIQCSLSPSVRVLPDVGGGRGAGVVARDFIKAGTLLARNSGPLVWTARVAPDCPWGFSGAASGESKGVDTSSSNTCAVTACDGCLCPYDHSRNIYPATRGRTGGVSAKRCSACKVVSYCSTDCQKSAWSRHKKECALFNHVRKASGGRGPNMTQRLVLRLLLGGHSLEEFAGGHSAAAAATQGAEATAVPATIAATKGAVNVAPPCKCSKQARCSDSAALSEQLNARAASAALLEGLLHSAAASPGGLQSLGLQALPRPGELTILLDRLSANVHSITSSGYCGALGDSPSGACPCCDLGKEVAVGLYGQPLCQFNHSCFPNAAVVFGGASGPLEMAVVASRSIMRGEEICISYVSPAAVRQERRNKLYFAYAFTCTCTLCCSCTDSKGNSSDAITDRNGSCSGSSKSNSEHSNASATSPSKSSNGSNNNGNGKGKQQPWPVSFSPAEAFDLQLRAVFCPKAPCVSLRSTSEANVLLGLENANQEYIDSSSHSGKASAEGSSGVSTSNAAHTTDPRGPETAARLRRLQLPVLCLQRAGQGAWEPVQICTGDTSPQEPPKQRLSTQRSLTIRLVPEELDQLASDKGHTHGASSSPSIRCCSCGDTYAPGDVERIVGLMGELEKRAQRLSQACCMEEGETVDLEGRAVLKLFSAARSYLHPGNLFLLNIAESINRSCKGFVPLYNGIGLTVSQHLSRAAAALHGRCSTQHADLLFTEGSLLHFLSQEDTEEAATQAWSLWAEGDPATAAARGEAGAGAGAGAVEDETGSSTRAKLALQARECLLQACSIFFSYEGCCVERQKGRVAEGRLADCERELQALGFPC